MNKPVGLVIALLGFSLVTLVGQSPSPSPSPETSASPTKHKHARKAASPAAAAPSAQPAASVSPGEAAEASPSPAKRKHVKKEKSAATTSQPPGSPTAAASTSPGTHSWFGSRNASPVPAISPSATTSIAKTTDTTVAARPTAVGGGPGMVWVNTESHTYHKEGSRWYGRTKKGKYLNEQDAIKEGDHADKGEAKQKTKP